MNPPRTAPALAIALAMLTSPAAAGAQYVVPTGNSAVNQYTETIPTAGGGRDADKGGGKPVERSPSAVLGARNARRLDAQGAAGQAAAEAAAATAPVEAAATPPRDSTAPGTAHGSAADRAERVDGRESAGAVGAASAVASRAATQLPAGSSGLGELLSAATGSSSSGQMGALLPLLLIGTLAWALIFLRRQRQRVG